MEEVPNDVVVAMEEVDRINDLPKDFFVMEIMSRLASTIQGLIRIMAIISDRWRNLCFHHHYLIFIDVIDLEGKDVTANVLRDYFSSIDNTIKATIKHTMNTTKQCPRDLNLKKFKLWITYSSLVDSKLQANDWIHYAIERNVKKVDLWLSDVRARPGFTFTDEDFFNNSCITRMTLRGSFRFKPPNGAINWEKLKSLCLFWVPLDDDMMKKIFSGSPCLESLKLKDCFGDMRDMRIDVTSKSVKKLVLSKYSAEVDVTKYSDRGVVKIHAPNISSLTIKGKLFLSEIVLDDLSSLEEAVLDYSIDWSKPEEHANFFKQLLDRLKLVKDVN
ncbi:ribonuclease H-like domain-containing protein, partial [Tanacetum coccineum]